MGEEKLVALVQESLSLATRTSAAEPSDFSKIIVDTTVQEKAVAFPTDAKLMHRARERLVRLAKKHGVTLRQSYERTVQRLYSLEEARVVIESWRRHYITERPCSSREFDMTFSDAVERCAVNRMQRMRINMRTVPFGSDHVGII
jgi:hypothetical protein